MQSISASELTLNLLCPPIAASISFIIAVLFIYIYSQKKVQYYLASFVFSLNIFAYSSFETVISFKSLLFENYSYSNQLYFWQQIIVAVFMASAPFFVRSLVDEDRLFKKVAAYIAKVGLLLLVLLIVLVYPYPGLFISFGELGAAIGHSLVFYGQPHYGPAFVIRNFYILFVLLFVLVYFLYSLIKTKQRITQISRIVILVFVSLYAIGEVASDHIGLFSSAFAHLNYPRLTIALTLLNLVFASMIIRHFFKQACITDVALNDLEKSKDYLAQIGENVAEIVWIMDYPPKETIYVNPLFEKLFNLRLGEIYRNIDKWKEVVHDDDKTKVYNLFTTEHFQEPFELEYRVVFRKGVRWLRDRVFPVRNKQNTIYRLIRVIEDISDRKLSEGKLEYLSHHDALTGLFNRKAMYEMMGDSLLQLKREKAHSQKAMLFIDLDRFKDVNETAGHSTGDQLLRLVSERLRNTVRETDYVFRIGGDEFIVVLNHIEDEYVVASIADKIINKLSKPYMHKQQKLFIGVSIGIALYPRDGKDIEDLIRCSDIALGDAKYSKNSFSFFNTAMNIQALNRVRMEHSLRRAVEKSEFLLNYQPFIDKSGKVVGMEALMRWRSDEGLISPSKFIPVAENTGQIVQIGQWAFEEACSFLKRLNGLGHKLRIAVNISPKQFKDKRFSQFVIDVINQNQVDPRQIELEITEGVMVDEPQIAIAKMKELHEHGILFSVDDFGTGYSSLSYIKQFPISHLKIDRCFISDLETDDDDRKITNAIVAMAHSLGIMVIAEGVETEFQRSYVHEIDCDEIQGFIYSKPLSEDEFIELLKRGG